MIGMESGRVRQYATLKSGTMGELQIRGLVECECVCIEQLGVCVSRLAIEQFRPSEKLQKCHAFIRQDRRLSLNG